MNPETEPNYYLVRTTPDLVTRGIVGVGWSELNFAEIGDAEEAIRQIDKVYGIGRRANQIRRFFHIAEGDVIVSPVPYAVAVGRATGGLFFDQAYYDNDRVNQRRVTFPRDENGHVITVPRNAFSEAFQRRLRVQGMTINDMGEFRQEIEAATSSLERGTDHSWTNHLLNEVEKQREEFRKKLLANIQYGKTNLQTGGVGLENLVCELLTADGYQAQVLSKQHFQSFADADVKASRTDRCASVNLLVQVKHHQGYSDDYGIRQLEEIQHAHQSEYDEYERVLVTSASVGNGVLEKAEKAGITVIGGAELVGWIGEHIEKLSKTTKLALGIYEVPAVL